MAKVTVKNILPVHTRTARAVIDWSNVDLAQAAGLSPATVRKYESGRGASDAAKQAMIDALEVNGVELLNGNRHGARLKQPRE